MTTQRLTYLGLESLWWGLLVVLCFGIAVGLVGFLYRYERRLVSQPVGWGLLGLRCLFLLTIFWMALQPTITWTSPRKEQTRVLVALDVSDSMDLVDTHANQQERLQWAVGLGMIKPEMLQNLEAERSETVSAASPLTDSWESLSRFELARQLLSAPKTGLLDRLEQVSQQELVLFSNKTRSSSAQDLTGSRDALAENLQPEITSYAQLLEQAAARENYSAVLLITDGVDTSPERSLEPAQRLAGLNRPVYSLLAGSARQPVDLAIESIDAPEMVYQKDRPLIRIRVGTHGYENQPLKVSLTDIATGNRLAQKEVLGGTRFADVEFSVPLNTAGRQRFVVEVQPAAGVRPVGTAQEETRWENNQQQFAINVIDDMSHVLLVDGEGRWEFRFLEAAFQRDERVDLQAVLFEQPYLGVLPHSFFASSLPGQNTPGGPFENTDLVIWGDVDPRDVEPAIWEQLDRFVGEQGGTVVFAAGKRYFPALSQNPVVSRLLPINHYRPLESGKDETQTSPLARGFHLQLTMQGQQHPVMKLETEAQRNAEAWLNLPGHLWGYAGVPKAGATVLASAVGTNLPEISSVPKGVVVMQNYGLGRVLWLGIDSTWRWRHRHGDRDHYRFWGQLSRWASEMRTSTGSEEVRFGLDIAEIQEGGETTVRARWASRLRPNVAELKSRVEVYPADPAQQIPLLTFPLDPVVTEPFMHEAKVPSLPVGEYRLRLKAEGVSLGTEEIETQLFVTPRSTSETNQLAADRSLLDQMAAVTQGAVFLPHQLDQLLEQLAPEILSIEEKQDFPLWNHWLVYVMMMCLLGGEWLLRKWHGLP